jgi:hypothetical protein
MSDETNKALARTNGGVPDVSSVSSMSITRGDEVAASALQAREVAMVQARVMQALARPRNVENFRVRLLNECQRLGFADDAIYSKPIGKESIEGLSVRFVERALALYGNVLSSQQVIEDGDETRTICCMVMDLETNVTSSVDMVVHKAVERKGYKGQPPEGREVLSERLNSYGEKVYMVRATDDETRSKQAAYGSFGYRNMGLKIMPADIVEEAKKTCYAVLEKGAKERPEDVRRRVFDGFASVGVTPADIEAFLGHDPSRLVPAELELLRKVWKSIENGESTCEQWMETRHGVAGSYERQESVAAQKIAELQAKQKAAQGGVPKAAGEQPEATKSVGGQGTDSAEGADPAEPAESQESSPAPAPRTVPQFGKKPQR